MEEKSMEGPSNSISPLPSWKLYDNPFFICSSPIHHHHRHHHHHRRNHHHPLDVPAEPHDHHRRLPLESDISTPARSWIRELKAELELERRLRKKVESLNEALVRQLNEERQTRGTMERELGDLSEENSHVKADMDRLRAEVAEERKMMRLAEVLREERVQMKLLEARLLMEEKLHQFSSSNPPLQETQNEKAGEERKKEEEGPSTGANSRGVFRSCDQSSHSLAMKKSNNHLHRQQRKEVENPHIRRGIIGYVEFPTRLIQSRAGGLMGSFHAGTTKGGKGEVGPKLECQKGQLRVLLKHNRVAPFGALGQSGEENRVM